MLVEINQLNFGQKYSKTPIIRPNEDLQQRGFLKNADFWTMPL